MPKISTILNSCENIWSSAKIKISEINDLNSNTNNSSSDGSDVEQLNNGEQLDDVFTKKEMDWVKTTFIIYCFWEKIVNFLINKLINY